MWNVTQHQATREQVAQGVVDLPEKDRRELAALLTFNEAPGRGTVWSRAGQIVRLVERIHRRATREANRAHQPAPDSRVLIGGAGFLMVALDPALREAGFEPRHAFSVRESREERLPDGTVRKVAVFRHAGFVDAARPERHDPSPDWSGHHKFDELPAHLGGKREY